MNRRKETNQRRKEIQWRFAIAIFQEMFGYLKIKGRTITANAMHAKRRLDEVIVSSIIRKNRIFREHIKELRNIIMIKLKFTKDMLTLLKTLKGQCLLSYEKEKNIINDNSAYGNIRLNFEKTSIDLVNEQELYDGFEEELACFSEVIFILFNKDFNSICPISSVAETWSNDEKSAVTINRRTSEIE